MIPRYSRDDMTSIWEEKNKFRIWMTIEQIACEAQAKLGLIPNNIVDALTANIEFDIERIKDIESIVKHDVIAFLTYVSEKAGVDMRYLHYGMTSSDVLDTCLAIQLKLSCDILLTNIKNLLKILRKKSEDYKYIICIARTHGIHAEPITLGIKFARFYAEFKRHYYRIVNVQKEISTCKISGATGNFTHIHPFIEQYVAKKMGLVPETISSQVIPRDRHAIFFSVLAVLASSIENIAIEIRHLQKTEIGELSEYFAIGQKGSSAMPHKCNPILSENLTGLSRLIRSYVFPALENVALWHERDISHSSVERVIAPDACITMDFALVRLIDLLEKIVIHEVMITKNVNKSQGLIFSQRILLELINRNVTREDAYHIVQRNVMRMKQNDIDFLTALKQDELLLKIINLETLESLFDLKYYSQHIDYIYDQVFN
ncbi:adenylosuccinate lyase [Wolbachia endosymbiont of Howardula sp.]|uniref:adenylosuccinate lyase n=1 Tax=Wolbachia endosymbiont of Howardula sp. TaxID=2916816 RepID=UPI00217E81FF|nr:adenylosuccinate lyase [Wolbachia endosymbiont of Howardula sp.]UWI83120.1 adenylosuccinate lyase [Wolbachia endosymbiont of Howardula sp.]